MKKKVALIIILILIITGILGYVMINKNEKSSKVNNFIETDIYRESLNSADSKNENIKEPINNTTSKVENVIETNNKEKSSKETTKSEEETTSENSRKNETSKKNKVIVIDPGHQKKGDNSKEPIGPGAKEKKAKVTTGATGISTKQTEAELNLKVGKKLKTKLEERGYEVIMVRTTNDVNISNSQRAEIANKANADVFLRIHADSVDNSSVVRNVYFMPDF